MTISTLLSAVLASEGRTLAEEREIYAALGAPDACPACHMLVIENGWDVQDQTCRTCWNAEQQARSEARELDLDVAEFTPVTPPQQDVVVVDQLPNSFTRKARGFRVDVPLTESAAPTVGQRIRFRRPGKAEPTRPYRVESIELIATRPPVSRVSVTPLSSRP